MDYFQQIVEEADKDNMIVTDSFYQENVDVDNSICYMLYQKLIDC